MMNGMTSSYLQIINQTDANRLIFFNSVIVLSNWLLFPAGWIQQFKFRAISIQIQHKTAIQLPIHPQPYLDWPVSSSFCSCSLWKMEKRCSPFFWIPLWFADRGATWNMVLSTPRIFILTKKLIISSMFFPTWVFRIQCRVKIRKPCSTNVISRSLLSQYSKKLVIYILRFLLVWREI